MEQLTVLMDLPTKDRMDAHREAAQRIAWEYPHGLVEFVRYVGPLANGKHRWEVAYRT